MLTKSKLPTSFSRALASPIECPGQNLEKKSAENEESIKNLSHWLSDEWIVNWLKTTPSLKAIDLKPYFYIAHDKVNDYLNVQEKLTPHVQSILAKLLSSTDLTQRQGLN